MSEEKVAPSELRYLFLALSKEWERSILEHAQAHDLTSAQVEILLVLNESGPYSMQDLGQMLLLNRDPFRSVDSLVAKGLVERGSGEDKRKVLWSLTAAGAEAAADIVSADLSLLQDFVGDLPTESTAKLMNLLRSLQGKVTTLGVLEQRFSSQQSPVREVLAAKSSNDVQINRSSVVASRLRQTLEMKDAGDAGAAFDKYSPQLAERGIELPYRTWVGLLENGGPVSRHVLAQISHVLTGNPAYLSTDDENVLKDVENHMRAENALLLAGVTGFGGRGALDAGALQALAELVQKRLNDGA
ncbi:MarR family winged helix-turn-helix transcriptional regulator [Arthrobacter sp. U41]|uniref:MarR family winged helix-turn-helix transcriptional regulator n=1 Tax=Arthrobacter sp. U41 TaxID=1849032 RepID=UPI000AE3CBBF|nr:MarR family transcriptional regulator [Arthrobacter sp. U41]